MADLAVTATITRLTVPGGPLAALSLEAPGTYQIARSGLDVGATSWRRETATSQYVAGRALTGAVKDVQTGRLAVRVYATSIAALATRIATLTTAFEQAAYTLTVGLDGTSFSWACECADWSAGDAGVVDELLLRHYRQTVTFLWPRHPTPITGLI